MDIADSKASNQFVIKNSAWKEHFDINVFLLSFLDLEKHKARGISPKSSSPKKCSLFSLMNSPVKPVGEEEPTRALTTIDDG